MLSDQDKLSASAATDNQNNTTTALTNHNNGGVNTLTNNSGDNNNNNVSFAGGRRSNNNINSSNNYYDTNSTHMAAATASAGGTAAPVPFTLQNPKAVNIVQIDKNTEEKGVDASVSTNGGKNAPPFTTADTDNNNKNTTNANDTYVKTVGDVVGDVCVEKREDSARDFHHPHPSSKQNSSGRQHHHSRRDHHSSRHDEENSSGGGDGGDGGDYNNENTVAGDYLTEKPDMGNRRERDAEELRSLFGRYRARIWIFLFLLGLINNFHYNLVISGANGLAEAYGMKSLVALVSFCNVFFGIIARILNAFVANRVSFNIRMTLMSVGTLCGLFFVALSGPFGRGNNAASFVVLLVGVAFTGTSYSYGESVALTYVQRYPPHIVGAWGSGTGISGVITSVLYIALTGPAKLSQSTLFLITMPLAVVYWAVFNFGLVSPHKVVTVTTAAHPEPRRVIIHQGHEERVMRHLQAQPGMEMSDYHYEMIMNFFGLSWRSVAVPEHVIERQERFRLQEERRKARLERRRRGRGGADAADAAVGSAEGNNASGDAAAKKSNNNTNKATAQDRYRDAGDLDAPTATSRIHDHNNNNNNLSSSEGYPQKRPAVTAATAYIATTTDDTDAEALVLGNYDNTINTNAVTPHQRRRPHHHSSSSAAAAAAANTFQGGESNDVEEDDDDDIYYCGCRPFCGCLPRNFPLRRWWRENGEIIGTVNWAMLWFYFNLGVVYIAEYAAQFMAPFSFFCRVEWRENFFVQYSYTITQFCYQLGVFISRSSLPCFHIPYVGVISILQVINAVCWFVQAKVLFVVAHNSESREVGLSFILFVWMFYVGLLGGWSYVNCFFLILCKGRAMQQKEENLRAIEFLEAHRSGDNSNDAHGYDAYRALPDESAAAQGVVPPAGESESRQRHRSQAREEAEAEAAGEEEAVFSRADESLASPTLKKASEPPHVEGRPLASSSSSSSSSSSAASSVADPGDVAVSAAPHARPMPPLEKIGAHCHHNDGGNSSSSGAAANDSANPHAAHSCYRPRDRRNCLSRIFCPPAVTSASLAADHLAGLQQQRPMDAEEEAWYTAMKDGSAAEWQSRRELAMSIGSLYAMIGICIGTIIDVILTNTALKDQNNCPS